MTHVVISGRRTGPTVRDAAATALVLGVAGAAWGGWAQQAPPVGWSVPLTIGSGLALLLAATAGWRTWRNRCGESAMADRSGQRSYRIAVGAEVAAILVGALVLALAHRPDYLAPWILFVVGVHFLPLARLFRVGGLAVAGVLLVAVACAAVVVGVVGVATPSAVAGAGALVIMLVVGVVVLGRSGWGRA